MFKRSFPHFPPSQPARGKNSFLLAGFFVASGFLFCANRGIVQAQEPARFTAETLQKASEAQMRLLWTELQGDCAALEVTEPATAISHYQHFFEQGAHRFPTVSVQISLRIARIWEMELHDYDKAIEIYDWALARYKNTTDTVSLEKGRLAAMKAQTKAAQREGQAPPNLQKDPGKDSGKNPNPPAAGNLIVKLPGNEGRTGLGVNVGAEGAHGKSTLSVDLGGSRPPGTGSGIFTNPAVPSVGKSLSIAPDLAAMGSTANPFAVTKSALRGDALGWRAGRDFSVTALTRQKNGVIWLATEDYGVWSCDPAAPLNTRWQQYNTINGMEENSAYALAVDSKNRVWVGTLNHGVSVWNGQNWKTYGVLEGPLGSRVFDIAVSPIDGDVWIATNNGLTRYSQSKDSWSYYIQVDGLPSNQVETLAFDKAGNLFIGTQCHGIGLARAADNYKNWKVVNGPEKMPTSATGSGLPSNLINDLLVAKNGTVYAATTNGLAWSDDSGNSWSYLRGENYGARVRGRVIGAPQNWKEASGAIMAEDIVTCLAEDSQNRLWVGHALQGNDVLERSTTSKTWKRAGREATGFVRAILPLPDGSPLIARYDEGICFSQIETPKPAPSVVESKASAKSAPAGGQAAAPIQSIAVKSATDLIAPLPTQASAPTIAELNTLLQRVSAEGPVLAKGQGLFEKEDWYTAGDWMGRYGRKRAMLCAAQSPSNNEIGYDRDYAIQGYMGVGGVGDDSLRHWVHAIQTDDNRTLYNPVQGYRRQAEWDDHGETYPMSHEGPDIWVKVKIPAGLHRLSMYFFNKDGHTDQNRTRDFLVELKKGQAATVKEAELLPTQAKTRVRDFWGGTYKTFLIQGDGTFWVKIGRNGSFNTIISGVFLDKVKGPKVPLDEAALPWMSDIKYDVPADPGVFALNGAASEESSALIEAARNLWDASEKGADNSATLGVLEQSRIMAFRAVSSIGWDKAIQGREAREQGSTPETQKLLNRWRWQMNLWTAEDRKEWAQLVVKGQLENEARVIAAKAAAAKMTPEEKERVFKLIEEKTGKRPFVPVQP